MAHLRYITHPNVAIDPDVAITSWGLSDIGRERAGRMLDQTWVPAIGRIVSSDETKAVETATILGDRLGLPVEVRSGIGENDRTATGFVPPADFERLADRFFSAPTESVRGWERAIDAQQRIVAGLADLLDTDPLVADAGTAPSSGESAPGDIAVIGHGGVGTLWLCHLAGLEIDRAHDQPGQGHYFTVELATRTVLHPWRPIDVR